MQYNKRVCIVLCVLESRIAMSNKISQTRDKRVMVRQVGRWKLWNSGTWPK